MSRTLDYLKIEYHYKEYETEFGILLDDDDEYYYVDETLEINRRKHSLSYSRVSEIDKQSYECLDMYEIPWFIDNFGEIEDKYMEEDMPSDFDKEEEYYRIEAVYDDGEDQHIRGHLSRRYLPKNYFGFMKKISDFLQDRANLCMFIRKWQYYRELLDDEYYYVSVIFGQGGREYYYKTRMTGLFIGDKVLVPVRDTQTIATISNIEIFNKENAPLPFEKTKDIIELIEDDDSDEDNDSDADS